MAETPKPRANTKAKAVAKPKATAKKPATAKSATAAKVAPKKTAAKAVPAKLAPQAGITQAKVKEEMSNIKDKAAETARTAAERGKDKAAEATAGIGKMIRDSATAIDDSVGKQYGDYVRSAADAVEGFADKVDAKKVDDIVGDARNFVRKSPAIAIGAAAAVGFLISRLVRSGRDET